MATICNAVDPEHRSRVDWCTFKPGHEGLHYWEFCDASALDSEYECQHTCDRERDHEPPHQVVFEW